MGGVFFSSEGVCAAYLHPVRPSGGAPGVRDIPPGSLVVELVLNELPCVTVAARLAVPATARSAELEGAALDEEWAPC